MDPLLTQISEALTNRLNRILIVDGYWTNAGKNVHKERSQFDPQYDDFPLVSLKLLGQTPEDRARGGRRPKETGKKTNVNLDIIVYGAIEISPDSSPSAHLILADIWQAMTLDAPIEAGDGLLPGEALIGDPDPDFSIVTVSQRYVLRYMATYGQ